VLLDNDKTTATFAPISVLDPLQSYTVTLTSGIKDLAGNRLNSENGLLPLKESHPALAPVVVGLQQAQVI
jgi:hypothetical protein